MQIRKLPPSAGMDWLLGALRLLRASPKGFGGMVTSYAGLWLFSMTVLSLAPAVLQPALELMFMVLLALMLAGMVIAAREVDAGREAAPQHLFAAIGAGKAGRVISSLIPQIAALLICIGLLYWLVGEEGLKKFGDFVLLAQKQTEAKLPIDPQAVMALPIGALTLWVVLVAIVAFLFLLLTLTMVPDMLFTEARLIEAMTRSFRACLRNLPAVFVFVILAIVGILTVAIVFQMIVVVATLVLGQIGFMLVYALLNGVLGCFISATMYFAWKQMLGDGGEADGNNVPPQRTGVAM